MPYGTYRYGASPNQQMGTYDYDTSFPNANYTFTDQEDDDETGLYNYGARLYDPQIGRFISADSIVPRPGDLQSFNSIVIVPIIRWCMWIRVGMRAATQIPMIPGTLVRVGEGLRHRHLINKGFGTELD